MCAARFQSLELMKVWRGVGPPFKFWTLELLTARLEPQAKSGGDTWPRSVMLELQIPLDLSLELSELCPNTLQIVIYCIYYAVGNDFIR